MTEHSYLVVSPTGRDLHDTVHDALDAWLADADATLLVVFPDEPAIAACEVTDHGNGEYEIEATVDGSDFYEYVLYEDGETAEHRYWLGDEDQQVTVVTQYEATA